MTQKIYSTVINGEKLYVKTYRKPNAVRFFKKINKQIKINEKDVFIETNINPSIKIHNELYPELIQTKKNDDKDNKYYNMFK